MEFDVKEEVIMSKKSCASQRKQQRGPDMTVKDGGAARLYLVYFTGHGTHCFTDESAPK